jgi:tetratricopeptide (TPR) repeat protein
MPEQEKYSLDECHKKSAADCFNLVWSLLEKENRSKEDDDKMVHAAHASRFHWGEVGTPLELERGEWQISRVYSVLNRPQAALHHAQRCLEICTENTIADFDIAFAHEAMARAYAASGNKPEFEKHYRLAKEAGERVAGKEDKDYFLGDLESGPWYGMK